MGPPDGLMYGYSTSVLVDAAALAFNSSGILKEILLYETGSPFGFAAGAADVMACSVEATMVSTPGPAGVTGLAGKHAERINIPIINTGKNFFIVFFLLNLIPKDSDVIKFESHYISGLQT